MNPVLRQAVLAKCLLDQEQQCYGGDQYEAVDGLHVVASSWL